MPGKLLDSAGMKRLTLLIVVFSALPLSDFAQKRGPKLAPAPCSLRIEQSPEVRGLKLDQSHNDLQKLFPRKLYTFESPVDEVGVRREVLSKSNVLDETRLSGISRLSLWYLDDKLVSIQIHYDPVPWQSNLHFTSAVVEQLHLPKLGWKNHDPSWLICDRFYVQTSSAFSLVISRNDLAPEIEQRIEAIKRKRRADFKP